MTSPQQPPYTPHVPVLMAEVREIFSPDVAEKKCLCDCTFGAGGHSFSLLEANPQLTIIAFDQDPEAVAHGLVEIEQRGLAGRVQLSQANFGQLAKKMEELSPSRGIDGVLFDLGVSTHHLSQVSRGFSFRQDGPLDMRMDNGDFSLATAQQVVEQKNERELADIIYRYGEERWARRIASAICQFRSHTPLESTKQLENIVFHCYPKGERHRGVHPATRTFQALRIYVNRELEVLERGVQDALQIIQEGGQIAVISFHSLEDRVVKHRFLQFVRQGAGVVMTRRPMVATAREQGENRHSRSAKLRVFKKGEL